MKISILSLLVFFSIALSNINAQEITMFPGFWKVNYFQDDKQISKQEVETLMLNDGPSNELWQKSKNQLVLAYVAIGGQFAFLGLANSTISNGGEAGPALVGSLVSAGVAVGLSLSSGNLRRKAILSYNNSVEETSMHIGPSPNGLGLVWNF